MKTGRRASPHHHYTLPLCLTEVGSSHGFPFPTSTCSRSWISRGVCIHTYVCVCVCVCSCRDGCSGFHFPLCTNEDVYHLCSLTSCPKAREATSGSVGGPWLSTLCWPWLSTVGYSRLKGSWGWGGGSSVRSVFFFPQMGEQQRRDREGFRGSFRVGHEVHQPGHLFTYSWASEVCLQPLDGNSIQK